MPRRFAPPRGFLCGARFAEVDAAGRVWLVWPDGARLPDRKLTLSRCLRLVRRGQFVELPAGE